jgi:hypothetical protein
MGIWDSITNIFTPDKKVGTPSSSKIILPDFPTGDITCDQISYLHPKVMNKVIEIINNCEREGFFIVETYRTPEKQDILYEQGRSTEGGIVTKARAWESYHNYGLALDISHTPSYIVDAFENAGFEWGGRWESFKDLPHFQMTFDLSVSDLKELYADGGLLKIWDHIASIS